MRISTFNSIQCYKGNNLLLKKAVENTFDAENFHQITTFFRYGKVDRIIINHLKKLHSPNKALKILSMGCSLGEEAYSYALLLDDLEPKAQICAFDKSHALIAIAKKGKCTLTSEEKRILAPSNKDLYCESEPSKEIKKIRLAFETNFKKKENTEYCFQKRENGFKNCVFHHGEAVNLEKMYEKNSYDIILCRYILFHFDNAKMKNIFKQANSVLKTGGLFCVEPSKSKNYESMLKDAGFKPAFSVNFGIFEKVN